MGLHPDSWRTQEAWHRVGDSKYGEEHTETSRGNHVAMRLFLEEDRLEDRTTGRVRSCVPAR